MWTLLGIALLWLGAAPAERCSMRALITERPSWGTLILAVALPDTVRASAHDFLPKSRLAWAGMPPIASWGQRFVALEVVAGTFEIEPGGEFVAVPWQYNSDCSPAPWTGSARWVEPGAEALFQVSPTRVWSTSVPMVDVHGWHVPYPTGEFWKYEGGGANKPLDRTQWLSAREYFELLRALPDDPWSNADRASVLAAVENAFARSGRLATTFPGNEVLAQYRRWAANGREE